MGEVAYRRRAVGPAQIGLSGRRLDLALIALLILASAVFVARHVSEHEKLSPIDEYVYVDYYAKVLDHGVVRMGEETGDFARITLVCTGVRMVQERDPALCAQPHGGEDWNFPLSGLTSADIYPPLYFLSTRVLAQPLVWLGVDLVPAGRAGGGFFWLTLGAVLSFGAFRRFGARPSAAFGAALLLVGSLPAYWSTTYLSTDATALASGGFMLLLASWLHRRVTRWPALLYLLGAPLLALFKFQNLVAVALVAVLLVVTAAGESRRVVAGRGWWRAWLSDRRTLLAIAAVGLGIVAQGLWVVARSALAVGTPQDHGISVPARVHYFLGDAFVFLSNTANGAVPAGNTGTFGPGVALCLQFVVLGGLFATLVGRARGVDHRRLAISAAVTAAVAGPALSLAIWTMTGTYVGLPARYGISLLPALVACAVLVPEPGSRTDRSLFPALGAVAFSLALLLAESA